VLDLSEGQYLGHELLVPGRVQLRVEADGAARHDADHGVDVDGGLRDAVQQELLVDDVLA
jgi:hypothetical protein